jgi:hypothetical protein
MRILLYTIILLCGFSVLLYAQEGEVQKEEFLNLVKLEEPSWVYKARGDRFFREGHYGHALAQYKKGLIRRAQEYLYQQLEGINIENGLLQQGGNLEVYRRILYLFRFEHAESASNIEMALEEKRYDDARDMVLTLRTDAQGIGAVIVAEDASMLERSIYLRHSADWNYLQKRLFGIEEPTGSLVTVLKSLNALQIGSSGGSAGRNSEMLELHIEENAPYPEINLKIAQIYMEEGLYEHALEQIRIAEDEADYMGIPDLIYEVLYTKAEIYKKQGKMALFRDHLYRIIRGPQEENQWRGDENFKRYEKQSLHTLSDTAIKALARDLEGRKKYGKAYFEYGVLKYNNRNFVTAEPYLKMAFLYRYGYEDKKEYIIAEELLKEYYISEERRKDASQIDYINKLLSTTTR